MRAGTSHRRTPETLVSIAGTPPTISNTSVSTHLLLHQTEEAVREGAETAGVLIKEGVMEVGEKIGFEGH